MALQNAQRSDGDESEEKRGGRPPVDKFQEGPFQVSIWQNPSSKGDFRTATLDRRYKGKDEEFHTSRSYSASDLSILRKRRARPAHASRAGRRKTNLLKASRANCERELGAIGDPGGPFLFLPQ